MSSKILKEALLQQKEVDEEETRERNPNALVFDEDVVATKPVEEEDDDDIDNFGGFNETQSQFGDLEVTPLKFFSLMLAYMVDKCSNYLMYRVITMPI